MHNLKKYHSSYLSNIRNFNTIKFEQSSWLYVISFFPSFELQKVYRARDLENDNRIVALKRLRVQASEEGMPLATVREIALLKQLERFDHPNIVRLLDVCCGKGI